MANGWTPERRARQAELIRSWRPWEKSTGPKTEAGKARIRKNGFKGGHRQQLRALSRQLNDLMRDQQTMLDLKHKALMALETFAVTER